MHGECGGGGGGDDDEDVEMMMETTTMMMRRRRMMITYLCNVPGALAVPCPVRLYPCSPSKFNDTVR